MSVDAEIDKVRAIRMHECDEYIMEFQANLAKVKEYCQQFEATGNQKPAIRIRFTTGDPKPALTIKFAAGNPKPTLMIRFLENIVKSFQIEKLIYNAFGKKNSGRLLPLLLAKYDDLVRDFYEILNDGLSSEGDYLEFCNVTLAKRNRLETICKIGAL